jgi:hypothetical protein
MKIYAAILILGNLAAGTAGAQDWSGQVQQVGRFDADVIFRAAQCELGQFTKTLHRVAPHLPQQQGLVEVSLEEATQTGVEGGLNLFFVRIGGSAKYETTRSGGVGQKFKISEENTIACTRVGNGNRVNLGLIQYLEDQAYRFSEAAGNLGGYAEYRQTVVGTITAQGGAKFAPWQVQLGFDTSASYTSKRTFTVAVRVPPEGFTPPPPVETPIAVNPFWVAPPESVRSGTKRTVASRRWMGQEHFASSGLWWDNHENSGFVVGSARKTGGHVFSKQYNRRVARVIAQHQGGVKISSDF